MSQTITIISIGPGDPELINEKTRKALLGKKKLVLRTEKFDSLAEAVSGYL